AELGLDPAADLLAESLDIGGRRVASVDQKIGVLFRHHRAAATQSAAADSVDQPPGAVAGWVRERRAAGTGADRLRALTGLADFGHAIGNRRSVAGDRAEDRASKDPTRWLRAVSIREAQFQWGGAVFRAAPVDCFGGDQHVLEFAAISAGIGAEAAADRAR